MRHHESGFTLIELIVTITILGILTVIAVPIYLNQKISAWDSAVEQDVKNTTLAVTTAIGQYASTTRKDSSCPSTQSDASKSSGAEDKTPVICVWRRAKNASTWTVSTYATAADALKTNEQFQEISTKGPTTWIVQGDGASYKLAASADDDGIALNASTDDTIVIVLGPSWASSDSWIVYGFNPNDHKPTITSGEDAGRYWIYTGWSGYGLQKL